MASVRHINLFPFCVEPTDNPNFTREMAVSRDLALSFWWRVKNWQVDLAELTVIPEDDPPYSYSMPTGEMTMVTPPAIPDGINPPLESEKNLVCKLNRQFDVGGADPFNDVGIRMRIRPGAAQSDELIKMEVDVFANLYTQVLFYANGSSIVPNEIGTGSIETEAGIVTFPIGSDFNGSALLEISAEEYWPYDPNDGGGPIYDSTTGAQLRGFPS